MLADVPIAKLKTSQGPLAAPDAEVFQILPGDIVRGMNSSSEAQRMLGELRYLEFYAKQLGDAVGYVTLELSVIEDADSQSGFRRVAGTGAESIYYGLARKGRKRLVQVRKELGRED